MILEILMTIAMLLYIAAYFIAIYGGGYWVYHILIAIIAFVMDMYATFLMVTMPVIDSTWVITLHMTLTLIAISLFFVQAYLGLMRNRKYHIIFAKRVFLPVWVVSYLSGFLFFLV